VEEAEVALAELCPDLRPTAAAHGSSFRCAALLRLRPGHGNSSDDPSNE